MHYVIIAVTFIATFLGDIFKSIFTSWLQVASKKFVIIAAVLAGMVTIVSGFYLAIKTIIDSISVSMPSVIQQAATLVIPDNFITLVSIQISARLLRFAYEWNVKVLQWRL